MQSVDQTQAIEVSVVIPCLNEQDTLARCIEKVRKAFREHGIAGEILVADNGSTDSSRTIAEREGARVVAVKEPGYGSALMGGIAATNSRFIVIGDADDSYDFLELPKIVDQLREGFDLVQGCRLPAGGDRPTGREARRPRPGDRGRRAGVPLLPVRARPVPAAGRQAPADHRRSQHVVQGASR